MGKRLLPSPEVCSRSPLTEDRRRRRQKLQEVLRRQQECRMAFLDLRSQIKSGLLEASDVFISLSIPLMKLVGLKAEEMAVDGKSSTILINPETQTAHNQGSRFARQHAVSANLRHRSDEEVASYSARAKEACEEISDKQRLHAHRLVRLLRSIGVHLNARQETIHHALDNTRGSFHHFLKRAASLPSLSRAGQQQPPQDQDVVARLAAKLLRAAHEHVSSALNDVEEEADSLLRALAEATCGSMAAHIRELRAEAEGGALARLSALVGEMEGAMGELRAEAALARKRARVAEEETAEAVRACQELQAALAGSAVAGSRKAYGRCSPISTSPRSIPVGMAHYAPAQKI